MKIFLENLSFKLHGQSLRLLCLEKMQLENDDSKLNVWILLSSSFSLFIKNDLIQEVMYSLISVHSYQ